MQCRAVPESFDFPLEVDDEKTLPPEAKGLYSKNDAGKFVLDPAVAKRFDNSALVSSLRSERTAKKELDKQVAAWKALGATPDEIKEKLDALGEKDGDDKGKAKLDKVKKDLEESFKQRETQYGDKISKMEKALHREFIQKEAAIALGELKGDSELLLPHITSKCVLVEEDGEYAVRVLDKNGEPRLNGKGEYLTVKELVTEMRASPVYGKAFDGDGRSGTGMVRSTAGGKREPADNTSVGKIARGLKSL
jgi:hypothetical protein